jgi:hypothetical protein
MKTNLKKSLGLLVASALAFVTASSAQSAGFPLGQLLLADSSTIYLVDPSTGISNRIVTGLSGLGDVVFNPVTGSAFAVVGSDIVQIKANGTGYTTSTFLSGIVDLQCLAVDAYGRVLFNEEDFVDHRIWRAELNGTATAVTASYFFVPNHMTFSKDYSKLYVFESPANDVSVVSFPSGVISTLATGLDFPPGGDSDQYGNVYVLEDFSTAKISRITPVGSRSTYASQSWMNFVAYDDLEYDTQTGTIYATSTSGLYALLPDLTNRKLMPTGSGWFVGLSLIRPGPAIISQQPRGVVVTRNSTTVFTVGVTGGGAVTYQWRYNGTNIAGATGSSLTIKNVGPQNVGAYSVFVVGAGGAALSTDAALTLLDIAVSPVVTLSGPVGVRYEIDFTENVQPPNWQVLTTVTANVSPMNVVDHASSGTSRRFYRVLPLP